MWTTSGISAFAGDREKFVVKFASATLLLLVAPTPYSSPPTPTATPPTFSTGFLGVVLVALEKGKSHPRHMDHPVAVNIALSGFQVAMGTKEAGMNGM